MVMPTASRSWSTLVPTSLLWTMTYSLHWMQLPAESRMNVSLFWIRLPLPRTSWTPRKSPGRRSRLRRMSRSRSKSVRGSKRSTKIRWPAHTARRNLGLFLLPRELSLGHTVNEVGSPNLNQVWLASKCVLTVHDIVSLLSHLEIPRSSIVWPALHREASFVPFKPNCLQFLILSMPFGAPYWWLGFEFFFFVVEEGPELGTEEWIRSQ